MTFQQFIETQYPLLKGRDYSAIKWSLEQVIKVVNDYNHFVTQSALKGEQR